MMYALGEPGRNARAFHTGVRPGMSLGEVVAAAAPRGRWYVSVHAAADASPVSIQGTTSATVGTERAQGEAEVRALLDRHAPALGLQSASFMFRGMAPNRSIVIVRFGADARVERIDAPAHSAD
ncbi:MAG: hypothetical protein NDJ94_12375 [Vicinamibacteria bacterium]|jgi:hypothetical protein|nr:hypothetical protein [Vicinamibacteria bacterium]